MMDAHRKAYREEANELLAELEISLLALEEAPADAELIDRVFRALHTIKGSGAMFGFDDIARFTHELETVFDLVRNEKIDVSKQLIDLTLAAQDQIRSMLDEPHGAAGLSPNADGIIESLRKLAPVKHPSTSACCKPDSVADSNEEPARTYRISLRFDPGIFTRGVNPLLLLDELRTLGECRVIAHTEKIPDLEELDPEECHISWNAILTTSRGIDAIKDVFIFVEDDSELRIEPIEDGEDLEDRPPKRLGEILVEHGHVTRDELREALGKQKRIGELLVEKGLVETSVVEAALVEQEHVQSVRKRQQQEEQASSIRVQAEKLDTLVNLVGELVTVQARLSQTVGSLDHPDLLAISEEVERLTSELRENTMSIRMLPIGMTFSKYKRLVRDLSNELGKEIALVTDGAETKLDKTVIERLNDPLVHLIRNCIDHGIELPAVREAGGKSRQGTIRLSASHSGANVLIRIVDDGVGLDAEAIKSKAIEKGLVSPDLELSEKEAFGLIFAPGFSTAQQVTNLSGRGVGMDVVKRSVETLRGSIEVGSQKGVGATVTLKLPLTLAIIDGLLVRAGEGHYVLPLSIVEECVELTPADVIRAHGRQITHVRGELVPYIILRDLFRIPGEAPEVQQIVITESAKGKVGVLVDKVIGEHQTVLKNLSRIYRGVEVISGATILGDGTVALILDVAKLVETAELKESMRH